MSHRRILRFLFGVFLGTIALLSFSFKGVPQRAIAAESAAFPALPFSTQGAQIVDAEGHPVLLRGVNWFGMETPTHAPHGLWARDYKDMLVQIKRLGYNSIRIPFSVASLYAEAVSGIDFSIGENADLQDKSPLEVLDVIIQEAERQGLLILLDNHQLDDQTIPELWYDDVYSEADWIDAWKLLAEHYRDQAN
ncbi:MAG: cellulase family glycosylhydrolase, partial [Cyanobacteria bacterium J06639_14]